MEYELVRRLKADDPSSLKEMYAAYWEEIFVYVLKVMKDSEEAQDIVQELFISIWNRRKELEIQSSVRGYLFSSARYITLRHIQNSARRKEFIQLFANAIPDTTPAAISLEVKELDKQIATCLNEDMPERMRLIFRLSREEQLSYKEIASQLGISEETVRKQIYYALKILRSKIQGSTFLFLYFFIFFPKH
ncbi:RNA polymerase sigma factor [Filimonas lacunae]|uniref:RNA polymerase sigma factor n=1 Tax=Filimonas lacunae TaxID=477680 RepID=UPI0013566CCC|nr:RNA polymerase sigma-70 factor [Filimonas lacunae]